MFPKDDEDFSTLQPWEPPPEPSVSPVVRKPEPASTKPPTPPVEPPGLSILSIEPVPELCLRFKLSDRAQPLLTVQRGPLQFLDALIRQELFEDATRFLAHALPQREAIGWAYLCARQAHADQPSPQGEAALAVVADWVLSPSEAPRLAARKAAEKAGLETPAGRACAAAFLSGPDGDLPLPLRKPSQNYSAVGVTAAVLCSATWGNAAKKNERFSRFLAEGRKVAGGVCPWETSK